MKATASVTALVTTYNRKALLDRCLHALAHQTHPPERILVVDNASTDGTREMLVERGWLAQPGFEYLGMASNTGGAGGFAAGLRHAVDRGAKWVWMMDDDAVPERDALGSLTRGSLDANNLYASVAHSQGQLAWPLQPEAGNSRSRISNIDDLPPEMNVLFAPFLGLLVSARAVEEIGTPDAGFFLAADDVDYCLRARKSGSRIVAVRASRIEHPLSRFRTTSLLGHDITTLDLPPWKRYYDVRNRILVAKNHYGAALYYATLPGTLVRAITTLLNRGDRVRQARAFIGGTVDGLRGAKGRRHNLWGLD